MKKLFILSIAFIGLASLVLKPSELTIGDKAPSPDTKMKDISGKSFSFNDVKKKNGVLVVFSCNTCPWVIKNQEVGVAAYQYALTKEVGVIILNSNEAQRGDADSKEAMAQYSKDQNYKWPYVMDDNSTMANAFGAKVTPECYLFDKDMKLVYHGAITDNPKTPSESTRDHLKVAIDELADGKTVSMSTSKAMGCGIKRKS
jgi:AhpC/TSA family